MKPNIVTYNSMIDACGEVGLIDKVEVWFQRLEANGLKPKEAHIKFTAWLQNHEENGLVADEMTYAASMLLARLWPPVILSGGCRRRQRKVTRVNPCNGKPD